MLESADVTSPIAKVDEAAEAAESVPVAILNPDGLHARPAAVLVNNAKRFASTIKIVRENGKEINAKSVVAIMNAILKHHDIITVKAQGADAKEAVEKLVILIRSGIGENLHSTVREPSEQTPKASPEAKSSSTDTSSDILTGTSASPGLVTGKVFQLRHTAIQVEEKGDGVERENAALLDAIAKSRDELAELEKMLRLKAEAGKAAIFAAHGELLDDPELLETAKAGIESGQSAAFAWHAAYTKQAEVLSRLDNELLAARANDIDDIGRRVLRHLTGNFEENTIIPPGVILIAEDLTPSDAAALDRSVVMGFATTGGSATSHASILARAAGIPAVAALDRRALDLPNGTAVVLDGDKGKLHMNPSEGEIRDVRVRQEEAEQRRRTELSAAAEPAMTKDGHRIKVVGNINGAAEAKEIPALGGEGVGLLRSEFLFLQRTEAPSEEEQSAAYIAIAKALGMERDLVVRTLDVGGDKPLAYLPIAPEANPFLGMRGIRLNQLGTELFTQQVRAILAAAPYARLYIMFPMISTVEEVRAAKAIVLREKAAAAVQAEVQIGIMVEVPSAALLAEGLAAEVDFFSIGTNDLTQYTLAIDRGHPQLAKMADALHPAVLTLIDRTVRGAHEHGKWVGVCGGVAGDIDAVPLLVGLGVDELSVSIKAIPAVKAAVRRYDLETCRKMAADALGMMTACEVRDYLAKAEKT